MTKFSYAHLFGGSHEENLKTTKVGRNKWVNFLLYVVSFYDDIQWNKVKGKKPELYFELYNEVIFVDL